MVTRSPSTTINWWTRLLKRKCHWTLLLKTWQHFHSPRTHVTSYTVLGACKFSSKQLPARAQLSRLHSSTLQEAILSCLKVQKTEGKVLSIHGCKHYKKMRAEAEWKQHEKCRKLCSSKLFLFICLTRSAARCWSEAESCWNCNTLLTSYLLTFLHYPSVHYEHVA